MGIDFCAPKNITTEITKPDVLEIVFTLPNLILDAENFKRLGDQEIVHEVLLSP